MFEYLETRRFLSASGFHDDSSADGDESSEAGLFYPASSPQGPYGIGVFDFPEGWGPEVIHVQSPEDAGSLQVTHSGGSGHIVIKDAEGDVVSTHPLDPGNKVVVVTVPPGGSLVAVPGAGGLRGGWIQQERELELDPIDDDQDPL